MNKEDFKQILKDPRYKTILRVDELSEKIRDMGYEVASTEETTETSTRSHWYGVTLYVVNVCDRNVNRIRGLVSNEFNGNDDHTYWSIVEKKGTLDLEIWIGQWVDI